MKALSFCFVLLAARLHAQQADSVAAQLRSVQRQTQSLPATGGSFFRAAWPSRPASLPVRAPQPSAPDCDPLPPTEVAGLVQGSAQQHQLQPALLHAVMAQESGFRPCATSPRGALGLMQLMPDTAAQLGVADALDPRQNVAAGARFLRQLLDRYQGDLSLALSAYNAGPGRVDRERRIPDIPETKNYVASILARLSPTAGESSPQP